MTYSPLHFNGLLQKSGFSCIEGPEDVTVRAHRFIDRLLWDLDYSLIYHNHLSLKQLNNTPTLPPPSAKNVLVVSHQVRERRKQPC